MNNENYNKLSPEEKYVIVDKGTEQPFSGKFNKHYENGVYSCKRCRSLLYTSNSKFDSGCGWPSFDDEIPGKVKKETDADGRRTEILCQNCNAHLGHVFVGEGLTPKNTRHCVNSISLHFTKQENIEIAIFASGCFWGTEYWLKKGKGVLATGVGYTGGKVVNPSYNDVCTGNTGHAEAVKVIFDNSQTTFEDLAKLYFETHDPTHINRQGPDIGTQYRSEIFYTNQTQKEVAEKLIKILEKQGLKVATQVSKEEKFYDGEEYHQDYYKKTRKSPYCHTYQKKF